MHPCWQGWPHGGAGFLPCRILFFFLLQQFLHIGGQHKGPPVQVGGIVPGFDPAFVPALGVKVFKRMVLFACETEQPVANVIGKIANGIADDMLTTTILACPCKKIISPAMNHNMYHNPIVQDNMEKLKRFGYEIIPPERGMLANGDSGDGRMPKEETLLEYVLREIAFEKDLTGKKVLVTAGATQEAMDPVRFITNHSSGKMGFALARAAMLRGAEVTVVAAHTEVEPPMFTEVVRVSSAEEMFKAVTSRSEEADIIIKAAAVADYTPVWTAESKIKKSDGELTLTLKRTRDILKYLGEHKREGQILCGFAMETEDLLLNARKKLESKNCDLICANSLRAEGAGFGTDTNRVTVLTREKEIGLELLTKEETAHRILDIIGGLL